MLRFKKVALVLFLVLIFISGTHLAITIFEVQQKVKNKMAVIAKETTSLANKFEAESSTSLQRLKYFYLFTREKQTFENWLSDNTQSNAVSVKGNEVVFNKEIEVADLFINSCERVNCLQFQQKFNEISPNIWKSLLGVEDSRFLKHQGVDWKAILRAIIVDIKEMRFAQGGSTLTQQLVKNLFLSSEKSLKRKYKEVIYAIFIESVLTKEEIITLYLNEVFWGVKSGIYLKGVGLASRLYFNKKPMFLSPYESLILISMLKGPVLYNPFSGMKKLKERVLSLHKGLIKKSLLSPDSIWSEEDWKKWQSQLHKFNSFEFSSLLTVFSTTGLATDYEKYILNYHANKRLSFYKKINQDADLAMKVFVTSQRCPKDQCDSFIKFYSKTQRDLDIAIEEEVHQVGSILKPILYKAFMDMGMQLDDTVSTAPIKFKLNSGLWSPKDSSVAIKDTITLREALRRSRNIPLLRTAKKVGFDNLEQYLLPLIPRLKKPLAQYPAQLIGAIELSLLEVASVYRQWVNSLCKKVRRGEENLESTIIGELSDAEKTTISKVASDQHYKYEIFGKTGTSNNGLDNWYVAHDGNLIYIIWMGLEGQRINKRITAAGSTSAFKVFENFIENIGKRPGQFHCE